jgi:quercetin dioxygenase-like cupin family protein
MKTLIAIAVAMSLTATCAIAAEPGTLIHTEVAPPGMTKEKAAANHQVLYQNIWADKDGQTHIAQCLLTGLTLKTFAPPASPYYLGIAPENVESIVISTLPMGWYGDWHHAPGPQWVIDLEGQWQVQAADGTTLTQGPGEFQFNSDDSAHAATPGAHVGHTARQIGTVPNVRMVITLKRNPLQDYANKPCVL